MTTHTGTYPEDWPEIAWAVKDAAGWQCIRCGHPHDPATGHTLTVHHLNLDKSDCWWGNLAALCQKCHLQIQAKVDMDRVWVMVDHSAWFRPYAAAHYARKYLGIELDRPDVDARLDELLALERLAVLGGVA